MPAIEHDGKVWLVPMWYEADEERWPVRMIRIDQLPQHWPRSGSYCDLVITEPIPLAVLNGDVTRTPERIYEVDDAPTVRFPLTGRR
jgi:hypothetical protein